MKKVMFAAAALLLAACGREALPESTGREDLPETGTYTVTFKATFNPETRLTVNPDDGVATWQTGDKIAIFTNMDNCIVSEPLTGADFDNQGNPTFTFIVPEGEVINQGAVSYYPASIAVDGQPNQIILPATYENSDILAQSIPMKAVLGAGDILDFFFLASMVSLERPAAFPSYPSEDKKLTKVVFSGGNNELITGSFTVEANGVLTPAGSNGTTISVGYSGTQSNFCFTLPTVSPYNETITRNYTTFTNGFSLSFTADDGFVYYRKTRSSSFVAKRATLVNMPAIDIQCQEFYLTGTATGWDNASTLARMIQCGSNSYVGALNSYDQGNLGKGLKILQGFSLGNWDYTLGYISNTETSFGNGLGNLANDYNGVTKVTLTLNNDSWTYALKWISNEYSHNGTGRGLLLVGSFDSWGNGITLTEKVGHNWYAEITVSDASLIKPGTSYFWKIRRADTWDVNWGQGTIEDAQLYSGMALKDGSFDPNDGTIKLSAGTYDVFFNDAAGQIMFVKK